MPATLREPQVHVQRHTFRLGVKLGMPVTFRVRPISRRLSWGAILEMGWSRYNASHSPEERGTITVRRGFLNEVMKVVKGNCLPVYISKKPRSSPEYRGRINISMNIFSSLDILRKNTQHFCHFCQLRLPALVDQLQGSLLCVSTYFAEDHDKWSR